MGCIVLQAHLSAPGNHNPVQRLPMPPPGVAARCDGHSLHTLPLKSHTTICTAHEEASVPISPSQKVLQGPPGRRTAGISAASSSISSPVLLLALASHSPAPSAKAHRRPSFGLTGLDPPAEIRRAFHMPRQNIHLILFDQRDLHPTFLDHHVT